MTMHKLTNIFLITAGSFFVVLGILGIFLPLLPTTPFLLLAAACYIRSSEKLYNWLINHKYLGNYIRNYREGKGVPLKIKFFAIAILLLTIGYTTIFIISILWLRMLLWLIAAIVSIHIILLPTLKDDVEKNKFQKETK